MLSAERNKGESGEWAGVARLSAVQTSWPKNATKRVCNHIYATSIRVRGRDVDFPEFPPRGSLVVPLLCDRSGTMSKGYTILLILFL
jgi:hypothetical protein